MTSPLPASSTPQRCLHFGECGGCDRLDRAYPRQLLDKRDAVARLLGADLDGIDLVCELPPRAPMHTRIKLSWPILPDAQRGLRLGMYRRGTHEVLDILECRIQDPSLTRIAKRAVDVFRDLRLSPYDEIAQRGTLRAFHARLTPSTGELMLGVTTRGGTFPEGRALADGLFQAAGGLRDAKGKPLRTAGVMRSIRDEPGNALLGGRHLPLRGRDHQVEQVAGLRFRLSFGSFWQNHRDSERVLYRPALALLGDLRGLRIVDGYGGVGAFGLRLARAGAAKVTIVESNPHACADARDNAATNALPAVDVVQVPFAAFRSDTDVDLAVVDPPRAGLSVEGVATLLALKPKRILCVACDARAFSRDLALLHDGGYRIRAARIADLFPHTEHVELLAVLERD